MVSMMTLFVLGPLHLTWRMVDQTVHSVIYEEAPHDMYVRQEVEVHITWKGIRRYTFFAHQTHESSWLALEGIFGPEKIVAEDEDAATGDN